MGRTALLFAREHPDGSAGYVNALARLEELVERAEQLLLQRQNGKLQVHAAAARKVRLRRSMKAAHLPHLATAAEAASIEEPELGRKFVITRAERPFHLFQSAARGIEAQASSRQELLEKYGLVEPVMENFRESLDQLESATRDLTAGRLAHVGARADLEHVAREIVRTVKLMDGFNRIRFARDGEALAEQRAEGDRSRCLSGAARAPLKRR